ncbi:TetR/AcrR family transcriptional regulator [Actinomadura rupiterrae]|uniref:TetR/AcrR family transcriptional regulator n=1 Tax=Actinomadura rupiterrae TaxID=559627 RepID=UPI0020A4A7D1|nr:TetR/AcrR family transcriptional regulator [Actinomadura rupiterrae]MCP2342260.1 DNA-binding transcriptional regulator YbjK [Actinomadura rupiterrae]
MTHGAAPAAMLDTPRRRLLADAAISTLARSGLRGLTHRAVDEAAGLPSGSCSAYFRTRQALLGAAVERLADTDLADIDTEAATAPASTTSAPDLESVADLAADLVEHLATAGRERVLARYELLLEATRRPELGAVLARSAHRHQTLIQDILTARGVAIPAAQLPVLLACLDGLLHERLVGSSTARIDRAEIKDAVLRLLRAFA